MAKKTVKKVTKKAVEQPKPLTRTVGKPLGKPSIEVFGIQFEQGDDYTFGKMQDLTGYRNTRGTVVNFIKIADNPAQYLCWGFPDGYVEHFITTQQQIERGHFAIVDFDTPVAQAPAGGGADQLGF